MPNRSIEQCLRPRQTWISERLLANIASMPSWHERVKSTTPSREPLLFKTVHEPLDSHGSSVTWCLSRIPHYQHILSLK